MMKLAFITVGTLVGLGITIYCWFGMWDIAQSSVVLTTFNFGPFLKLYLISRLALVLFEGVKIAGKKD